MTTPEFYFDLRQLTCMTDEVDEQARKIAEESIEMGDRGPVEPVDGECVRCGDDATWQDPINGDLYCEEHATEYFRERHN